MDSVEELLSVNSSEGVLSVVALSVPRGARGRTLGALGMGLGALLADVRARRANALSGALAGSLEVDVGDALAAELRGAEAAGAATPVVVSAGALGVEGGGVLGAAGSLRLGLDALGASEGGGGTLAVGDTLGRALGIEDVGGLGTPGLGALAVVVNQLLLVEDLLDVALVEFVLLGQELLRGHRAGLGGHLEAAYGAEGDQEDQEVLHLVYSLRATSINSKIVRFLFEFETFRCAFFSLVRVLRIAENYCPWTLLASFTLSGSNAYLKILFSSSLKSLEDYRRDLAKKALNRTSNSKTLTYHDLNKLAAVCCHKV